MARKTRYTVKDFEKHITGSGGIISTIAARVGCHRDTCSRWIENSPTLKAAFEAELQAGLDEAESVVNNNIRAAAAAQRASGYTEIVDSSDARWKLSRLGKDRGYGDSQEITGAGGGPIEIAAQVMSAIDKVYGENEESGG